MDVELDSSVIVEKLRWKHVGFTEGIMLPASVNVEAASLLRI